MAEVDVSSYKQPALPSTLDTIDKFQRLQQGAQAIQSNELSISKQQLDLANARFDTVVKEINSLPPEAGLEDYFKMGQRAVNAGIWQPEQYTQFVQSLPADPKQLPAFKVQFLNKAMHARDVINWAYGQNSDVGNGQTVTPGLRSNRPGFAGQPQGGFIPQSLPIQQQVPPTAPTVGPGGQPQLLGPQAPQLAPGTVSQPSPLPVGPINNPAIRGQSSNFGGNVLGAVVEPPTPAQSVTDRFPNMPRGPAIGLPPGVGEAETQAGSAAGRQLAEFREKGANFQRDVFPLMQAIPDLEKLGTKGTGPGTETINNLKSFILSNVPGINEKDPAFSNVPTYDKAKKYLTQIATEMGGTGTNDKLAATFAANPSVGISNAAAKDVAKSILTMRRFQAAQQQEWDRLNLPASQFPKWLARSNLESDPRAFGVDLMSDEAKAKLRDQLNKNKKERDRFERSLELAHGLGFITPQ